MATLDTTLFLWGIKSVTLPQLYPGKHTVPGTLPLLDGPCVTLETPFTPQNGLRAPLYPLSYARHLDFKQVGRSYRLVLRVQWYNGKLTNSLWY